MNKKKSLITIIIFGALLGIFTIADICTKDRIFSENENRVLAAKPNLTGNTILSGQYSEDYENYVTDQFAWRDMWISLKTRSDIALGKKDINDIYLAADNYLIEKHSPTMFSTEDIDKKSDMLIDFLQAFPETKIMLAPTADNVISDKLPSHAVYFDERNFLKHVKNEISKSDKIADSAVIDLLDTLSEHKDKEIYYKTDHHWTSLGAYYAYLAWADATSHKPYDYNTDKMKIVTDDFKGTLHSKINIGDTRDEIRTFSETYDFDVNVLYDNTVKSSSLYEKKHLNTKNKYGYFLDDNHGIIEITNNSVPKNESAPDETGKNNTLIVIKDSYANSFIPLLVPHYEKIYVIDLRYFREEINEFIQKIEKTDTLILYNCIHFLENFKYASSVKRS